MTEHSGVTSVNNFTLWMQLNLAHSIGLGAEEIIPNREDLSIRGTYMYLRYYTSLTRKLFDKFGIDFHSVQFMVMATVYIHSGFKSHFRGNRHYGSSNTCRMY